MPVTSKAAEERNDFLGDELSRAGGGVGVLVAVVVVVLAACGRAHNPPVRLPARQPARVGVARSGGGGSLVYGYAILIFRYFNYATLREARGP